MAVRRENVTGRALADPALVSHHAIVVAERQGFDDGYFRTNPRQLDFASQAERIAYDTEFGRGVEQRARAYAFANEPAKPKRKR